MAAMNELLDYSLTELSSALQDGRASASELMEAVLERIEQTNDDLNAVVAMYDEDRLMREAREADERIRSGDARPLEGIPLGVKDLEDAEGLVTSQGSLPFKDQRASTDSTQVARLKAAGAIALGKTNSPEFGYTAITKNLIFGVTRNPWSLERTPGGSSGGSSAALTSGMLPLVTGSDGGGSIRIPASFTGAFGLKTSFGRIPKGPLKRWTYEDTSVYGPLTKTVEDGAQLDFLQRRGMALLARTLFLLLILEFAVVHDATNGRARVGGYFHQVESPLARNGKSVLGRHHTQLFAV